ncbi:MAG: penicillin-binding transpeptidase domain-containing protein, partial [Bdellovibrionales bacterium]
MNQPDFHNQHHWHAHSAGAESAARSVVARARARLLLIAGVFTLAFIIVLLQLAHVTVFNNRHGSSSAMHAGTAPKGVRADILDRNGELLATSLPVMSAYIDAQHVIEPEIAAEKINTVLPELNREQLLADMKSGKRFVWLKRALSPAQHQALHNLGLPGLSFQQELRRMYPHGALFAHALGYVDVDGHGLTGFEKGMDQRLRDDPAPLRLSLDKRLQYIMKKELAATIAEFSAIGGGGMIMDTTNGEILAFVSLPDFDPQRPAGAGDEAAFNRLTLGIYEMGSTFKIFNTALALESGKVRMGDMFDVTKPLKFGRFTIRDFHPEKEPLNVT